MADTPILFNAPHDWRTGYSVQLEFSTEINQSDDGTEQRIALRYMPVKTVNFALSTAGEESRRVRAALDARLANLLAIPQWTSVCRMSTTMVPGNTYVDIPNRPYWLQAGYPVIFMHGSRMQMFEVTVTAPNAIRIDPPVSGADWPAGTKVYRPLLGYMGRPSQLNFNTAGAGQYNMTFNVEPESELGLEVEGVAPMTYNGKEFFAPDLDWSTSLTATFDHLVDRVYFDRGVQRLYPRSTHGIRTMQARTYIDGENGADPWVQFFMRCRGRQVPFYMPTGQPDLLPSENLWENPYLQHEGLYIRDAYQGSQVFKHIQVLLKDGTRLLRRVVFIGQSGVGDSIIEVDTPWPRIIQRSEILMVSWVTCCRLASDNLLLEWQTQNRGSIGLSVQTLADE